jgi:hypothetical protein
MANDGLDPANSERFRGFREEFEALTHEEASW